MAARVQLQSIKLKKSGQNKFAGYSYFELGDFLPEIQNIFNNIGLCGVVSYDIEYARLCITDVDDGTAIVITSPMAEANLKGTHPIQNLGAVETYQRRYLWMTAMEIVEHDILDASEPVKEQPKPNPVQELKAPTKHVKGKVDPIPPQYVETKPEWTMIIDAPDDESWVDMMVDMNNLKISMATDADQLKQMFQVNKPLYDKLKALNPSVYADVIDNFTKAKRSFF
jgi:hypothetical protein